MNTSNFVAMCFLVGLFAGSLANLLFYYYDPAESAGAFLVSLYHLVQKIYSRLFPKFFCKHAVNIPYLRFELYTLILSESDAFSRWQEVIQGLDKVERQSADAGSSKQSVLAQCRADFLLPLAYRIFEGLTSEIVRNITIKISYFPEYLRVPFDALKEKLYKDTVSFLESELQIGESRGN